MKYRILKSQLEPISEDEINAYAVLGWHVRSAKFSDKGLVFVLLEYDMGKPEMTEGITARLNEIMNGYDYEI